MPTACSTALEAMATTTRPVNTWDRPRALAAGRRASTNHSETGPEASVATPRTDNDRGSGQGRLASAKGGGTPGPPLSQKGLVATETPSSTTAVGSGRPAVWWAAGVERWVA